MKKTIIFILMLTGLLMAGANKYMLQGQEGYFTPERVKDYHLIKFSNGITIDTRTGDINQNLHLGQIKDNPYILVHFSGPITEEQRREVEEYGKIVGYLHNYTYMVKTENREKLWNVEDVDWIGEFRPEFKISRELDIWSSNIDTVVISLFMGEDFENVKEFMESKGKVLFSYSDKWGSVIFIETRCNEISSLAMLPSVRWIEPYHPLELMNATAQWVMQTFESGNRKIWDKGIKGEGEILAICDSGVRTDHDMFRDDDVPINDFGDYPEHRKIIAYKNSMQNTQYEDKITFGDEPSAYYHGTHTSGSACGNDDGYGTSANDGMAPEAKMIMLDAGGGSGGIYAWASYTFKIGYEGNVAGGARIFSNSWGNQTTRTYDAHCVSVDQFLWEHKDALVLFSGGNTDHGPYTGSPANAKSVVAVGGTGNGTAADAYDPSYASIGYAGDGRVKPDIVAPGRNIISAYGGSTNGYVAYTGTSMSCPIAAGSAALIREYLREGWYGTGEKVPENGFIPSGALLKAMLIAATDMFLNYDAPDPHIGWGRPVLDDVLYFKGDTKKLRLVDETDGLKTNKSVTYKVNVANSAYQMASEPLKVVLCWTDYPGNENASPAIMNNLNLEVISPSGVVYKGNIMENGYSVENPDDDFDDINTVEVVHVENPESGTWTINVYGQSVPFSPQPYALVITGDIDSKDVKMKEYLVDDSQGNNDGIFDPGETVSLIVTLRNVGSEPLAGVQAKLTTTYNKMEITDSLSSFGDLNSNSEAQGDEFILHAQDNVPDGREVSFILEVYDEDSTYYTQIPLTLTVGTPRFDNVDMEGYNVKLTVTKYGAIGYLVNEGPGNGFSYPKSSASWLYYASFAAATDEGHVMDRFYEDSDGTPNNDWEATSEPEGRIVFLDDYVADHKTRAIFTDSGAPEPIGLYVYQYGYSFDSEERGDFVILRYILKNISDSDITGLYAGIIADFDMPSTNAQKNYGGVDEIHRIAYMKQETTDNPHVGVMVVSPDDKVSNLSLLKNFGTVYTETGSVWADDTLYKFLKGDRKITTASTPEDYSVVVGVGPLSIPQGDSVNVSFAFVGGDDKNDLLANATEVEDTWRDILKGIDVRKKRVQYALLPIKRNVSPQGIFNIGFSLPERGEVEISVYNALGQRVKVLYKGMANSGTHYIVWEGNDDTGRKLGAGVYFIKADISGHHTGDKVVILK